MITAAWWSGRPGLRHAIAGLGEGERAFLLAGALLVLGCFVAAQNIGYRAVHLLLVLPPLLALRHGGAGAGGAGGGTGADVGRGVAAHGLLALGEAIGRPHDGAAAVLGDVDRARGAVVVAGDAARGRQRRSSCCSIRRWLSSFAADAPRSHARNHKGT